MGKAPVVEAHGHVGDRSKATCEGKWRLAGGKCTAFPPQAEETGKYLRPERHTETQPWKGF